MTVTVCWQSSIVRHCRKHGRSQKALGGWGLWKRGEKNCGLMFGHQSRCSESDCIDALLSFVSSRNFNGCRVVLVLVEIPCIHNTNSIGTSPRISYNLYDPQSWIVFFPFVLPCTDISLKTPRSIDFDLVFYCFIWVPNPGKPVHCRQVCCLLCLQVVDISWEGSYMGVLGKNGIVKVPKLFPHTHAFHLFLEMNFGLCMAHLFF